MSTKKHSPQPSTASVLTCGLQIGWMSTVINYLKSDDSLSGHKLSSNEISWIASSIAITALLSCQVYGYAADVLGRKITLIMIAVPQIFGFALKLVSAHPICLIVSQVCCGLAGGGVYCVAPVYLKEICQESLRGILGSLGIFLTSLGIFLMYLMGSNLGYNTVLWIVVWVPIVHVIGLLRVPESPAFLVKTGKVKEATEVMAWLRGVDTNDKEVQKDINITKKEIEQHENLPAVSFKSILSSKSSRKAFGLSFLMLTISDLGANYAILAFASQIIREAGVEIEPDLQSLLFPLLMGFGTLVSAVTVERFGRKTLLLLAAFITVVHLTVLGTMVLLREQGASSPPWVSVFCIVVCLYASGQNMPLPFIVMAEMFSVQLRTKVLSVVITYGWSLNFLQTFIFIPMSEKFGMYSLFYGCAAIDFVLSIICYIVLPETKGKTAEEISDELIGRKKIEEFVEDDRGCKDKELHIKAAKDVSKDVGNGKEDVTKGGKDKELESKAVKDVFKDVGSGKGEITKEVES